MDPYLLTVGNSAKWRQVTPWYVQGKPVCTLYLYICVCVHAEQGLGGCSANHGRDFTSQGWEQESKGVKSELLLFAWVLFE